MRVEELREIAKGKDRLSGSMAFFHAMQDHTDALLDLWEAAEALYYFTNRDYDEKREPLYQALKKLEAIK